MGCEGIRGRTGARAVGTSYPHIHRLVHPLPGPYPRYRRLISTRRGGLTTNGIHATLPASLSNGSGPPHLANGTNSMLEHESHQETMVLPPRHERGRCARPGSVPRARRGAIGYRPRPARTLGRFHVEFLLVGWAVPPSGRSTDDDSKAQVQRGVRRVVQPRRTHFGSKQ